MKCEKCKKREATTHITKIINGYKEEHFLCSECAKTHHDITPSANIGIGDFLTGILGGKQSSAETVTDICPICNMTYNEFLKKGKLGCGNCYSIFRSRLLKPIKQIHGTLDHIGKIPCKAEGKLVIDKKISSLQKELADAIEKQDFENAARLRDEIRDITAQSEKEV